MTIDQFIFGFPPIDPIRLQVDDVKFLKVYSERENQKDVLRQVYEFNEFGRVACRVNNFSGGGWTAYPPLNETKEADAKNTESKEVAEKRIVDIYVYSPLGNLMKIETRNINSKKITAVQHLAYDINRIVSINSDALKTTISRNQKGEITSIMNIASITSTISQSMESKFTWDNNQVTERSWEIKMEGSLILFTKTKFIFDNVRKIIGSEIHFEDDQGKMHHSRTELEYLNQDSNLISSMVSYENDKLHNTSKYKYDAQHRLIQHSQQSVTLNKNVPLVTKYVWS